MELKLCKHFEELICKLIWLSMFRYKMNTDSLIKFQQGWQRFAPANMQYDDV